MSRKTVSAIMLSLLVISTLTLAFKIQSVEAADLGTYLYIQADGSIQPSTAPIQRNGDTYTLNGNITFWGSAGIKIERNNMTLDGAGFKIEGQRSRPNDYHQPSYSIGIDITARTNVTIKNVDSEAFFYGAVLDGSSNNTITQCNMIGNVYGIYLVDDCADNIISESNITESWQYGIYLYSSSNNAIYHNFMNNYGQVYSSGSTNVWDDGHPFSGNYWSDYNRTSDKSYVIDANNVDHYPLIVPYGTVNPKAQQQSWLFRPEVLASIVGLVGLVLVIAGVIVMRRKRTKIQTLREDVHLPPPRQPTPT